MAIINGTSGPNNLVGTTGNDRIDGLGGADVMAGGLGNDVYFVDDFNDQVIELLGEGKDVVYATTNYILGAGQEVEFLRAFGTAATAGVTLTGNALDNAIFGGTGDDTLDGGSGGNDKLVGGDGNDTLITNGASAVILGGTGNDTIILGGSSASTGTVDGGVGFDTVRSTDLGGFVIHNVEVLDTFYGFLNATAQQLKGFDTITAALAAPDTQIALTLRGAGGVVDFTSSITGQTRCRSGTAG